jgi:hypothetical protein
MAQPHIGPMCPQVTASPEGLVGRVTGKVAPGTIGEVLVVIRGGREAFYALPCDDKEEIPIGADVLVIEYRPPRTVLVTKFDYGQ